MSKSRSFLRQLVASAKSYQELKGCCFNAKPHEQFAAVDLLREAQKKQGVFWSTVSNTSGPSIARGTKPTVCASLLFQNDSSSIRQHVYTHFNNPYPTGLFLNTDLLSKCTAIHTHDIYSCSLFKTPKYTPKEVLQQHSDLRSIVHQHRGDLLPKTGFGYSLADQINECHVKKVAPHDVTAIGIKLLERNNNLLDVIRKANPKEMHTSKQCIEYASILASLFKLFYIQTQFHATIGTILPIAVYDSNTIVNQEQFNEDDLKRIDELYKNIVNNPHFNRLMHTTDNDCNKSIGQDLFNSAGYLQRVQRPFPFNTFAPDENPTELNLATAVA